MQSERLLYQNQLPLLACNDIRAALLRTYASDAISDEQFMQILKKRHQRRKKDIDLNFEKINQLNLVK
jgi:hypothetical protein